MAHFEGGDLTKILYRVVEPHVGHEIECTRYGITYPNLSIECMDCGEVIIDIDFPDDKEDKDG